MPRMRLRRPLAILAATLWWLGASPAPAAEPRPLVISQPADAVTLDPAASTQVLNVNLFYNLYDCLTAWDAELRLIPQLATSWKNVDPTTWEFKLRKGVRFHDGEPFDAESVKFTLERVSRPGKHFVQPGFATIERVDVVDPLTVRVVTKKPDPLVPSRMAQMGCQIIPVQYVKKVGFEGLAKGPVGTGPYRLAEWVKDDRLVLDANPDYWAGKPKVARVIWKPIPDNFARVGALMTGEVDVITNVPPDQVPAIKGGKDTAVLDTVSTRTAAFFIAGDPPLNDRRVRQALNYAVDKDGLIKNLFGGFGIPFGGGLANTDFGYNPDVKPYPYDPDKARALLKEANATGMGLSLKTAPGVMPNAKPLVEAVAEMYGRVGLRASVELLEMAVRQKILGERLLKNSLLLVNPQSTTLDADGSIWRLLHPNGLGGIYWEGSKPGHRFHELMEEARYSLDPKKRLRNYHEASRILHEDAPWVYLFQEVILYGVHKRVGFRARPDFRLILTEMTVNP